MTKPENDSAPMTSFRALLRWLDDARRLRHVRRRTDPRYELAAVMRKVQKTTNEPLLFENVSDSKAAVATNIMCRRDILAASLGLAPERLVPDLALRERRPLMIEQVADAPVHEVAITDRPDIAAEIPQIVHCERDAGPYVTAGICVAQHPVTGVYNASWNRVQLVGGAHARVRMMPPQHLGQYQALAEASNRPLPVAIVVGAPPALMLSAASKIPLEADEYQTAGAWQNAPLRVVAARTVPLLVPADAEYVIEGEVLPHVREEEGPFGEFTDAYVEAGLNHVLRVTAITRRSDAVYHVILAGGTEDSVLLGVPLQVEVYKRVAGFASVRDIAMPGHIFGCVISIEKTSDEQARAVLLAALAAHHWMKVVIVVDADIDPHDADEVLWAIHTRHRPDDGLYRIPRVGSFQREDVREVHRGKVGIDATVPVHLRDVFRRRRFPGSEHIHLEDYLQP